MPEPIPLPRSGPAHGWALLAVLRAPADEGAWDAADPALGVELVAEAGLAALVAPAAPPGLDAEPEQVAARHWEVHRALLRGDVGFRTEVDVYMGPDGPEVTTPEPQTEVYALLSDPRFA